MNSPTFNCPECRTEITLSETLAAEHIEAERVQHRKAISDLKFTYEQKTADITKREGALQLAEHSLEEKLAAEREKLSQHIEQELRKEMQQRLTNADQQLLEKDQRLKQAESQELESRKRMAAADEKLRQAELDVQRRLDEERKALQESSAKREAELKEVLATRETKLAAAEKQMVEDVAAERTKLSEKIRLGISNDMKSQLNDAQQRLAEKDKRLQEANGFELASRKRMADADEKLRQSELDVQRRLDQERTAIREKTLKESSEEGQRKLTEKDQIIEQMNKRIELLHRQADSKSQQLQGDLEEASVFSRLREHFSADEMVRVPTGRNGADIVFKVKSPSGKIAGTILIEVKDTQNFTNHWIAKLKSDTHDQGADIGLIVSRALPSDIELFDQREDSWICRVEVLVPLLTALRNEILHVSRVRSTTALTESTRDVVFSYLTSSDFTRRVTTMVDGYDGMRSSLDKQKRQFQQRMTEQERALDKMIAGLSGVYGDLTQRAVSALAPVSGLELDEDMDDIQPALPLADTHTRAETGVI